MSDGSDQTTELPRPEPPAPSGSAYTTQLPAAPPGPSFAAPQIALVFCAIAAASFLFGIALATATRPSSDETVVVSEDVDPSGKVITFEGGEIRFPSGAVDRTVRIVVRRSAVTDRIRVESTEVPPGRLMAYSFEPDDIDFEEPVDITFRLPRGARNAAVFARRDSTVVLLTGTIDADDGTATAVVHNFRFESGSR